MISIAFLVATAAFAYVLDAVLVGVLFGLLLGRMTHPPSTKATVGCLLISFAFLDHYWWPAALALHASITIENEAIANLLGFGRNVPLASLFSPDLFDLLVCFIQSWLAFTISNRVAASRTGSANRGVAPDRVGGGF